ncbi:GntR family transcriptional regulator [Phaeobacter inhibens]|uniref:GntR family transcriptional regulator n=1 Tax=Phaeobacter inhibens TaxID=221822 RepID=UPI0024B87216|nr:GntR family transcriptional regulator [Phaeobacter inhibens]WHP70658.1 GntR family transcriptional regulator [Phaeobacter inhibens]
MGLRVRPMLHHRRPGVEYFGAGIVAKRRTYEYMMYSRIANQNEHKADMARLSPSKPVKLSTRIHKEFQDLLVAGEFKPGEKLRVADLMEQTGTSITPVREALIQLVSENAVEMYSPRAFAIPALSLDRYQEIRAMRLALEGIATEAATPRLRPDEIERLQKLHDAFVAAEAHRDGKATLRNNREFHFLIYRAANMPLLLATIERLWAMMGPILNVFYEKMETDYTGAEEHLNILAAVRADDGAKAAQAMQNDLRRGGASIEAYISRHTEMAEEAAGK